jgi:hypothetical protein
MEERKSYTMYNIRNGMKTVIWYDLTRFDHKLKFRNPVIVFKINLATIKYKLLYIFYNWIILYRKRYKCMYTLEILPFSVKINYHIIRRLDYSSTDIYRFCNEHKNNIFKLNKLLYYNTIKPRSIP